MWLPWLLLLRGRYDSAQTAPFHPFIHNFGNVGALGMLHAAFAPLATERIDALAYGGRNLRRELAQDLARVHGSRASVLDVGCGVGILAGELAAAGFERVRAVDTSDEMLAVARCRNRGVTGVSFERANGVDVDAEVDVAVALMLTHEMPRVAHEELISNLARCTAAASGETWIVDIDPAYEPSLAMLSGEPYLPEYLRDIDETVRRCAERESLRLSGRAMYEGHVRVWVLAHATPARSPADQTARAA